MSSANLSPCCALSRIDAPKRRRARRVITDSEFYWERKTGKKTSVYFTNDDGAVKSNNVIIPAD